MEELTAKRRDELIDWFVDQVTKRGLTTPAIIFLEVNRPMTFVASSLATFLGPIVGVVLPPNMMDEIAALLADRSNVDLVIDRLEKAADLQNRRDRELKLKVQEERKRRRLAREGKLPAEAGDQPAEQKPENPPDPQ
ncbi:MAG: hypothetical protein ACM3XN_05555 [Chloroflexota bacterium]